LVESGTLSPNPWDLSLWGQNGWITLMVLERRIGLRRDATRAPILQCRNGSGRPPMRSPEQEDDDPVGPKLIQAEKWS